MNWPTYAAVRETSEVEWIDQIPATWMPRRLRTLYDEVDVRRGDDESLELLSVSIHNGVRFRSELVTDKEARADDLSIYKVCRVGDIVLNRMRAFQGGLGASSYDGIVSPDYMVMRPGRDVESLFLAHLMKTPWFVEMMSSRLRGIGSTEQGNARTPRINPTDLGNIVVALPSRAEQVAIVQFLGCETGKIDALIVKQEQLIATLREDRAATITQAVTKGLDPNVEMKDSEVQWIGTVPIHWLVDRIKNSVESARNGIWGSEPDGGDDDIRCVRVADFDRPQLAIHDRDVTFRKVTASERDGRILQRGDLILEKSGGGDKNPVGFVVLYEADEPAVCSNFVARVRLARGQCPKFWTYVHHCLYQSRLTYPSIKQNTGIQNLDQQSYFNERVAFPSLDEQEQIASFLDAQCSKVDSLIAKSTEMIDTLREYRSALITDAVTGKIDVRGAA